MSGRSGLNRGLGDATRCRLHGAPDRGRRAPDQHSIFALHLPARKLSSRRLRLRQFAPLPTLHVLPAHLHLLLGR